MKKSILFLVLIAALVFALSSLADNEANLLTPLTDLRADTAVSGSKKIPLLIAFTAEHCPFCATVKEEFLHPMQRGGLYVDKVIMREVDLDSYADVITLEGKNISVGELGKLYGIKVVPTLLFIDQYGKELVPGLVGIRTVDYYGGFLDDAIDQSLAALEPD